MSTKETLTSKVQVVITDKNGISKIVDINNLSEIIANSGDKFQLIKTVNGEKSIVDNFIVIKNGETLELSFASGETLSIENFYSYNNVEVEFTVSDNSVYTLSSQSSFGHELSDGTTLVYAQGNQSILLSMANGNESLHAALSDQITIANSEHFAAAEAAPVVGAAEAGAGTFMGMASTTAALVVGGVVVVGAAVASNNSSSSTSSDSSSTSSDSSSTSSDSSSTTGYFVDSAVSGVTYIRTDADGNETGRGTTSATGGFEYEDGETITFVIENANGAVITLGSIDAADVNADGNVMPQDLAGVARTDTSNATVQEIAQLLQSLDSDGDASNGLQITSAKIEEVFGDKTDGADLDLSAAVNGALEGYVTDDTLLISDAAATAHLNTTTKSLDSTLATVAAKSGAIATLLVDITLGEGTDVIVTDVTANIKDIQSLQTVIGTGTITFSALTSISGNAADLIADSTYLNAGLNVTIDDTVTIAQYEAIDAKAGIVTDNGIEDTIANLLNDAGTDSHAVVIAANTDVTITDAVTLAQITLVVGDSTTVVANTITDTAANLAADLVIGVVNYVAATNGVDGAVVTVSDTATVTQMGLIVGHTDATLSYSLTDTVTNLLADAATNSNAGTYIPDATEITVSNAVATTMANLVTIDAITEATVTATKITDTGANLLANAGGYVADGVDVEITNKVSIAQISAIDALNGDGALTLNGIADTIANLTANVGDYVTGEDVTITDAATIAQITSLDAVAGTVVDTIVQDIAANIINAGATGNNPEIVVTNATITAAQADTIDGLTAGIVTATVATSDIVTIEAALDTAPSADNAFSITINDTTLDATALQALVDTDGYTSEAIDATSVTSIAGTAANLAAALSSDGITLSDTVTITPDFGGTTAAAADLIAMDDALTTAVDATTIDTIRGTVEDLAIVLNSTGISKMPTVDGTISLELANASTEFATDIIALNNITVAGSTLTIDAANDLNIAGTVANAQLAFDALDTVGGTVTAIVTGTTTAQEIIDLKLDATVNAAGITSITGTLADINTAITGIGTAPTAYTAVLAAEALAATAISTLAGTTATVDASAVTSITGTAAQVATALDAMGTTPTSFTVEISDAAPAAADLTTIANTDGVILTLTADVQSLTGTATEINEYLAINTTGNFIVALGAVSQVATELTALEANANVALDAALVTELTGTIAEVNAAETAVSTLNVNYDVVLTAGAEIATEITALDATNGAGTTDGSALTSISGTIAEVAAANGAMTSPAAGDYTIVLTAGTEAAGALGTLAASDMVDASALTSVTETSAATLLTELAKFGDDDTMPTAFTVTITGAQNASDLVDLAQYAGITIDASGVTGITGTSTEISAALAAVDTAPTDFDISVSNVEINASAITALDALNGTGDVASTATIVNGTVAEVKAVINQASTTMAADVNINLSDTAGTTVQAADLVTIDVATIGNIAVTNSVIISGTEANITNVLVANGTVATTSSVIVTDAIAGSDFAKLNAIDAAVEGTVTASITITDTTGQTLTAGDNAYTITVTDTTVSAAELLALDAATTINVTVTPAITLTGTAAQIDEVLNSSTITLNGAVTIGALGTTANAEDLLALDAASTDVIDASTVLTLTGTVADIKSVLASAGITNPTIGTAVFDITDAEGADVLATDLSIISAATTKGGAADVTFQNDVNITGTYADVTAALVTATNIDAGAATVAISDAIAFADGAAVTAFDLVTAETTGAVTATVSGAAADLATLSAEDNVLTITIDDDPASAAELKSINDATIGTITLNDYAVALSGTASDLLDALDGITGYTGVVTVSDAGATALSATDLTSISALTTSAVTVTNAVVISGTTAEVTAALVTAATSVTAATALVTITDAADTAIAASDLSAIGGATTGVVTVSNAVAISGNAAEVTAETLVVATTATVEITGNTSVAEANALDAIVTGAVTATITEGDVDTLKTLVENNGANKYTITITDTGATAAELATINAATTLAVGAAAITTIESSAIADVLTMITAIDNSEIALDGNWDVTLSDTATLAEIATVNDATEGAITLLAADVTAIENGITTDTATAFAAALDGFAVDSFTQTADLIVTGAATEAQLEILTNALDVSTFGIDVNDTGLVIGTQATFSLSDITEYAELTLLDTIDMSSATNTALTLTAAELFAVNDTTGDLTFTVAGTANGGDTVNLSGWTEVTPDAQYTITGNFDGVVGDETYTVNVTNAAVTIA